MLIQICLIVGAVLAFVSTVVFNYWIVLSLRALFSLHLISSSFNDVLSKAAGKEQGFVAGMNSTYTSLGNIAGPAMGGILFDMNIHYPYAFSGVVLIVGLAITFMWREKQLAESFAK